MSTTFEQRVIENVVILGISGRIDLHSGGSASLRDKIRDIVHSGYSKIVLNLKDTVYVDSSGIGEFISAFTSLRNIGGDLKLVAMTKRLKDLLQITKLYTVFDVYDTEEGALDAFRNCV